MKKLLLLGFLLLFSNYIMAVNESEPNDTWNTADPIGISLTGNGEFSPAGENDWWTIVSATDGNLLINFSSLNGQNVYCEVFDTLGVIQLSGSPYTSSSSSVSVYGLSAGRYYIRFKPYYSYETTVYSFSTTWTTPAEANDIESNNSYNTAQVLNLNSSTTGHVNYYYNGYSRDTTDWYAVTVNQDGNLSFTITSGNGQNVYALLYDGDGSTYLAGSYTTTTNNWYKNGLAPGTYYILVKTYYNWEYVPYTLSNTLIVPSYGNDPLPNDFAIDASTLNLNDSVTGHIGYRYNGDIDLNDWWKVTIPEDGALSWTITSENGANVYAVLYDGDTISNLGGSYTTTTTTYTKNGLAAGTYYIFIRNYYTWEYAPYQLKNTFTPTGVTNDTENNDTYNQALTLNVNDTVTGHIGYRYNGYIDLYDWYEITLPEDGALSWTITSMNGAHTYAQLYDNDATTYIGGSYTTTSQTYSGFNLAAGTYYIRVRTYYTSEYTPYTLSTQLVGKTFASENPASNMYAASATVLPANTASTGHINYYYNGIYDVTDWWCIGFDSNDTLRLKFEIEQNSYNAAYPYMYIRVYAGDTTTSVYSNTLTNNPSTDIVLPGLAAGKYFVKITKYGSDFGAYRLTPTFLEKCLNVVSITGSSQTVTCNGSIDYSISGGITPFSVQLYKDGTPFGSPQSSNGIANFTNLNPGTYYLRSYSYGASGLCNNVSSNTVFSQPSVPVITPSGATSFCAGGSVTLTSTAASSYLWSNGATTQSIVVNSSGNYIVTVYNAALCQATSSATNVTVYPGMTLSTTVTNLSCYKSFDGSMYIQISGGTQPFTYLWSDGRTNKNRPTVKAGSYTFTVTDANGCTASVSLVVTQPAKLLGTKVKTPVSCNGGSDGSCIVNITGGTAPYTYLWNTVPAQTTNTATGLSKGVYQCITTDANGCTRKNTVFIPEPAILWINMTKTDVTTNGGSDGTCTATPAGGNAPYSYVWNNGATTSTITGLSAGTYTCTVTDDKGCTVSKSKNVSQPPAAEDNNRNTVVAQNGEIFVYPNPNNGSFDFRLDEYTFDDKVEVKIFDATGRVIFNKEVNHTPLQVHRIELSQIENGIYLIKIKGKNILRTKLFTVLN